MSAPCKTYDVRKGTKVIREQAFSECKHLKSVTIPDTVTTIGECAFDNCSSLKSIVIPDSVTSIGVWAFNKCTSLKTISIPDSVATTLNYFTGCFSIKKSLSDNLIVEDGVLYTKDKENVGFLLIKETDFTIPDTVEVIVTGAFFGSSLRRVTIPKSRHCHWRRRLRQLQILAEHRDSRFCDHYWGLFLS